jgi:hypothetical protein
MLPRQILYDYPLFIIHCSNLLYLLYQDLCLIKFYGELGELPGFGQNRNSIVLCIKSGG